MWRWPCHSVDGAQRTALWSLFSPSSYTVYGHKSQITVLRNKHLYPLSHPVGSVQTQMFKTLSYTWWYTVTPALDGLTVSYNGGQHGKTLSQNNSNNGFNPYS